MKIRKISRPSTKDTVVDMIDNPCFVTELMPLNKMTGILVRKKINESPVFGYDIYKNKPARTG